jgi:hypothetical protein
MLLATDTYATKGNVVTTPGLLVAQYHAEGQGS